MEVVCDFETCNPYCDVTVVGSTVYAQHWATEILCLRFSISGDPSQLWVPDPGLQEGAVDPRLRAYARHPDALFIAHNAGFEKDIWREIMVPLYGFPDIPNERWHDTMASAAYRGVPLALEKALPALDLGEKDGAGKKLTISLSKFRRASKKTPVPKLPAEPRS